MDAELIAGVAGILLSLMFGYVPGVSAWYEGRTGEEKRLLMLAALMASTILIVVAQCAGLYEVGVACSESGAREMLRALIAAVVANQATYLISTKSG